jgi:centrin-1
MSRKGRGGRDVKKQAISEDELEELKEAFNLFDNEGKGTIDVKDLKTLFLTLGMVIRKRDVKRMMTELDKEGQTTLQIEDILELVSDSLKTRTLPDEMGKMFAILDDDNTGGITIANLKRIVAETGETLTDAEVQEMVREADSSGKGKSISEARVSP